MGTHVIHIKKKKEKEKEKEKKREQVVFEYDLLNGYELPTTGPPHTYLFNKNEWMKEKKRESG